MLKRSAQQGAGLFRIANYFIKDELDSGELVEVLEQEKIKDSGGLYMLYPQLIYPPYKLRVFIDFVKAYFQ
jgi:DNA-binding transcriptional LysR family regulator